MPGLNLVFLMSVFRSIIRTIAVMRVGPPQAQSDGNRKFESLLCLKDLSKNVEISSKEEIFQCSRYPNSCVLS
jgi:hypothetical protein